MPEEAPIAQTERSPVPTRSFARPSPGSQGLLSFDLRVRADRLVEWLNLQRRLSGEPVHAVHTVARAVSMLFEQYPALNVRIDAGKPRRRRSLHLLVRTAPEAGGKSPDPLRLALLKNTAGGNVLVLTREVERLSAITGESFFKKLWRFLVGPPRAVESASITALGVPGIQAGPILPAEGCALSVTVGALEERAVVDQGEIVKRWILPVGLSFDLQGIDPGAAHFFCRELKTLLESPRLLETPDQHTGAVAPIDTSTEVELPEPTQNG